MSSTRARRNVGKTDRPVLNIRLEDLPNLRIIVPQTLNGLPFAVAAIFESRDITRVGLVHRGHSFDASADDLALLRAIQRISEASSEGKEKRGETLAKNQFPDADEKLIQRVSPKLLMLEKMIVSLDTFEKAVKEKKASGLLHDESKKILLRICPQLRGLLKKFKEKVQEKTWADILKEDLFPPDLANRIVTGSLKVNQMDLIHIFFPSDPGKHLNFSLKEIRHGVPRQFAEILQSSTGLLKLFSSDLIKGIAESIKTEKVSVMESFRVTMIYPLATRDTFKVRVKRIRDNEGTAVWMLHRLNAAFLGPQFLVTGLRGFSGRDLASLMFKRKPEELPENDAGFLDLMGDESIHTQWVCKPEFMSGMFQSYGIDKDEAESKILGAIQNTAVPEFKLAREIVKRGRLKFVLNPEIVVRKEVKEKLNFTKGNNRIREPGVRLIKELMERKRKSEFVQGVKNWLSQMKQPELQDFAAEAVLARISDVDISLDIENAVQQYARNSERLIPIDDEDEKEDVDDPPPNVAWADADAQEQHLDVVDDDEDSEEPDGAPEENADAFK